LSGDPTLTDRNRLGQQSLNLVEVDPDKEPWEYAALVTSLDAEIPTIGQFYRDRADCENAFDTLKKQWLSREADRRSDFTTRDLTRCRPFAGTVALIYNW
jgi:hypothetical protein